jgi:ATP-dependent protease ClpP protease subunit
VVSETETLPTKEQLKRERQQIDIEVRRAELELKKLELTQAKADAKKAELEAETKEFHVAEYRRTERRRKATEKNTLIYQFDEEIYDASVSIFTDWLQDRVLRFPGEELTVYLNSPGGSVFAGFVAMDAIREAEDAGNKVTVKVTGMAASMAGVIAQAASTRLIGKNSELMIHVVGSFNFGHYKSFEVHDQAEFMKRLTKKCLTAYADRSEKWDADGLFAKLETERRDWWITADEAVTEGFMDGTF